MLLSRFAYFSVTQNKIFDAFRRFCVFLFFVFITNFTNSKRNKMKFRRIHNFGGIILFAPVIEKCNFCWCCCCYFVSHTLLSLFWQPNRLAKKWNEKIYFCFSSLQHARTGYYGITIWWNTNNFTTLERFNLNCISEQTNVLRFLCR